MGKQESAHALWSIGCFGCPGPSCPVPTFWALVRGEDPPPLRCPACGAPALFRGWTEGLQDLVPALAPLLPGVGGKAS
jgi:hypothetical protein